MYGDEIFYSAKYQNILARSIEQGIAEFLSRPKTDIISERKAHQLFGKAMIDLWLRNGLIEYKLNGTSANSRKNFSYRQLKSVANQHNIKEKSK